MKFSLFPAFVLSLGLSTVSFAGSATWNLNPMSGDWSTAANWTPATVPNGPTDIATFDVSNSPDLSLSASSTEVSSIAFNPGASSFNITVDGESIQARATLTISGSGIINNSGVTQNLLVSQPGGHSGGSIYFVNEASAGDRTTLTAFGASPAFGLGTIYFFDRSTCGTANIFLGGAEIGGSNPGGALVFVVRATAGNASVTVDESVVSGALGGHVAFNGFSSAGNAVFVLNSASAPGNGPGTMLFIGNATAENATFTLNGPTTSFGGANIYFTGIFEEFCTAGNGFFTINGGQVAGGSGAFVDFEGQAGGPQNASAGTATLIANGGDGEGAVGGMAVFDSYSTASQATLIANGGTNGGRGGTLLFAGSDGGEARIELFGNGRLDPTTLAFLNVGSLEGDGLVVLARGQTRLITGANNLSTTFSGLITGEAGSLTKVGTGSFTLSGANTYTGGTTIEDGKLLVSNRSGSGTGTGAVQVNGGQLGGRGVIAGAVVMGTGSGSGATLAPGERKGRPNTLTIQSALTFNADGAYECGLDTKRAVSDKVVANGVTINGARFTLHDQRGFVLPPGRVLTAIDNTSANSISGTFSNLADGATVSVGSNTYQANYEGGDGNDLTLTVVP